MRLLDAIRQSRRTQDPLIEVHISKDALVDNYNLFQKEYGISIAPVLKSNAYGHGLLQVADTLAPLRPPFFVVDSIYEAQMLRRHGIKTPILVVGYTRKSAMLRDRLRDVSFTISSLAGLRAVADKNPSARVHIKIDTGMRRQGIPLAEVQEAISMLKKSRLNVEGVCSHFADADGEAEDFTRKQIREWNEAVSKWKSAFRALRYYHLAATAGSAFSKEIDGNVIRLGTGLYGFPRHASQTFPLRPALSMHSIITGVKELSAGESIGYNCTFTARKPMKVATVPVGYFEGVDRRLSNTGTMLVGGIKCPILGRVSMNISSIDISNCPNASIETSVTVFSDKHEDTNSLRSLAEICSTTPLELLVHIPQHLRRVVV